jgi:hypothetical protein
MRFFRQILTDLPRGSGRFCDTGFAFSPPPKGCKLNILNNYFAATETQKQGFFGRPPLLGGYSGVRSRMNMVRERGPALRSQFHFAPGRNYCLQTHSWRLEAFLLQTLYLMMRCRHLSSRETANALRVTRRGCAPPSDNRKGMRGESREPEGGGMARRNLCNFCNVRSPGSTTCAVTL